MKFIQPELLILIPVLYLLGLGCKKSTMVEDRFIPIVLGTVGIALSCIYILATNTLSDWRAWLLALFMGLTQGILTAGASVFFNQIYKQLKTNNKEDA